MVRALGALPFGGCPRIPVRHCEDPERLARGTKQSQEEIASLLLRLRSPHGEAVGLAVARNDDSWTAAFTTLSKLGFVIPRVLLALRAWAFQ